MSLKGIFNVFVRRPERGSDQRVDGHHLAHDGGLERRQRSLQTRQVPPGTFSKNTQFQKPNFKIGNNYFNPSFVSRST